jgi:hypothetical protein
MKVELPGAILRETKVGIAYYYPPERKLEAPVKREKEKKERPMAPLSQRAKVYEALLEYAFYNMADEHVEHLMNARGLSTNDVRWYGTLPPDRESRQNLVHLIQEINGIKNFHGIPGFYEVVTGVWTLAGPPGILIPYRTPKGQIQGFQIRQDEERKPRYLWFSSADKPSGTSATNFTHYQNIGICKDLWICEGGLKAQIIGYNTGESVCGLSGSHISDLAILENVKKRCGTRIILCPDADFRTTKEVAYNWHRNIEELEKRGFEVRVALWEPEEGKGVDDYYLEQWQLPKHVTARRFKEMFPLGEHKGWGLAA